MRKEVIFLCRSRYIPLPSPLLNTGLVMSIHSFSNPDIHLPALVRQDRQ